MQLRTPNEDLPIRLESQQPLFVLEQVRCGIDCMVRINQSTLKRVRKIVDVKSNRKRTVSKLVVKSGKYGSFPQE